MQQSRCTYASSIERGTISGYGSTSTRATHPASRLGNPAQVNITRQEVRTCGFSALGGTDKPIVVMLLNSLSPGLVCAERVDERRSEAESARSPGLPQPVDFFPKKLTKSPKISTNVRDRSRANFGDFSIFLLAYPMAVGKNEQAFIRRARGTERGW